MQMLTKLFEREKFDYPLDIPYTILITRFNNDATTTTQSRVLGAENTLFNNQVSTAIP